jgi:citrate lyase alpha subunit
VLAQCKEQALEILKRHQAFKHYESGIQSKLADQIVRKLLKDPDLLNNSHAIEEHIERMAALQTI